MEDNVFGAFSFTKKKGRGDDSVSFRGVRVQPYFKPKQIEMYVAAAPVLNCNVMYLNLQVVSDVHIRSYPT